jgi:hypothetical protein
MNPEALYAILATVARNRSRITYGDLSESYYRATPDWHEPHGSWDRPLGELSQLLHAIGWPPLSAVVVLQGVGEPGGCFLGSSPIVPRRPARNQTMIVLYSRILAQVHAAEWPDTIPIVPLAG